MSRADGAALISARRGAGQHDGEETFLFAIRPAQISWYTGETEIGMTRLSGWPRFKLWQGASSVCQAGIKFCEGAASSEISTSLN